MWRKSLCPLETIPPLLPDLPLPFNHDLQDGENRQTTQNSTSKTRSWRPDLGLATTSLEFFSGVRRAKSVCIANARQLSSLLPLIPNLVKWELDAYPDPAITSNISAITLPSLRTIAFHVAPTNAVAINPEVFSWLSKLGNVRKLSLSHWDNEYDLEGVDFSFPKIDELFLMGDGISESSAITFINACPNLIKLRHFYTARPGFVNYGDLLSQLEVPLRALDLMSNSLFHLDQSTFAKYTELRYLRLCLVDFPPDLHRCLFGLQHLENLNLMSMTSRIPIREFQELVDGPRRLSNLRKLTLNMMSGCVGLRVNPFTEVGRAAIESKECEDWLEEEEGEWFLSCITELSAEEWLSFGKVVKTAQENGISVDGEYLEGIATLHAYLLKLNNLSIVRAYYHSNFHTIPHARQLALAHRFPLPELDIDSIDSKKLELIKVEMEEHGWFALTLRNK